MASPTQAPARAARREVRPWIAAAFVGIAACALASDARAQRAEDKAQAEALFEAGRTLALTGDHTQACLKFAASQRLDPAVGTLLNLADCNERSGKLASAWAHLREAAALARGKGDAGREEIARAAAAALEPRLSRLVIVAPGADAAPGLVVKRDGSEVERGFFGTPVPVDAGLHTVDASAPGRVAWRATVEVGANAPVITVTVPPLRAAGAQPVPPRAPSEGGMSPLGIAGVALAGVGLASVVAGGVLGFTASSTWQDARSHCGSDGRCDPEGVSLGHDAGATADASTACFVAGGVGLLAGAVLWLAAPRRTKPDPGVPRTSSWLFPAW